MIGPWKITINKFEYIIRALTWIDAVIALPEVIPVDNVAANTVAQTFEDSWLSRYPLPKKCIHDNGNGFLNTQFVAILQSNNINSISTMVKNLQVNAVVERLHQTISTIITFSSQENKPTSYEQVSSLIHSRCMAAQYAISATQHFTLSYSPG